MLSPDITTHSIDGCMHASGVLKHKEECSKQFFESLTNHVSYNSAGTTSSLRTTKARTTLPTSTRRPVAENWSTSSLRGPPLEPRGEGKSLRNYNVAAQGNIRTLSISYSPHTHSNTSRIEQFHKSTSEALSKDPFELQPIKLLPSSRLPGQHTAPFTPHPLCF
ncbi:hypothetical protein BST61_g9886 [Cercospora zeina]